MTNIRLSNRSSMLRRSTLALALSMGAVGIALAQSTTGSIFGQAKAGATLTLTNDTGFTREVMADAKGRYIATSLPLGTYTVTLKDAGTVADTRKGIELLVNSSVNVSFASADAKELAGITVTASALPAIDVSSVDSRSVITAEQLKRLPLGHSAEAIALLAPGVVAGSSYFSGPAGGSVLSFGGSSVTENAYYINGFNTSDPLKNMGGIGLPFGAIDQQETYTGGYSAMYGRSDGGVISQVGKRGSNEWHFGVQTTWEPRYLASDPADIYYPDQALPAGYTYNSPELAGTLYRKRKNNTGWDTTYSAYLGGPLIRDRLFFFAAAEIEKDQGKSTEFSDRASVVNTYYTNSLPKYYVKLDWHINDSNLLELTDISSKNSAGGKNYQYDYASDKEGGLAAYPLWGKYGSDIYIGKYTGYITDDLTLSATYGQNRTVDYAITPGLSAALPYLSGVNSQNPALNGGEPIRNGVPTYQATSPGASSKAHGLRLDVEYKLGNHVLAAGIDNMHYTATDEGQAMGGPGYGWYYGHASIPSVPLDPSLGVGAPGGEGYYADKFVFVTSTDMAVDQKAQYLEDRWQVSDRLLLSLGLRNDRFTNFNSVGEPFVSQDHQWAPRLGFSWDVAGDASFKIYGSLGRYYLALPNSVAIRGASASTNTDEYFTYAGIDARTGEPLGLKSIGPGAVSANGEYGQTPDAKTIAPVDLRSEYQDEAILGFSKSIGPHWISGVKITLRKLQSAIDDVCDSDAIAAKVEASDIDPDSVKLARGCVLFNPGQSNTLLLANADDKGYTKLTMTTSDWGFDRGVKRKYYALDLFLEHPFDGKWAGRVDYTYSRSYGNTEGQVLTTVSQDDVSKTIDWDSAALMENSNGILSNDRTHQLKANASYKIASEWMVSATLRVQSGAPKACLGYYGADESDPLGYHSSYHFCARHPTPMGSLGRLPWTKTMNLGVTYSPKFAQDKLAFNFTVFNALNERKPVRLESQYESEPYTVSNAYGTPLSVMSPRSARLSVTYDF